jgi:hypothetical protein
MWLLAFFASLASAQQCESISMRDVLNVAPPAVIVLGERRGTQPDLARATAVARRLSRHQPVTVALEAVHRDYNGVLDDYAVGRIAPLDLPDKLAWSDHWPFHYTPYQSLVTGALFDAKVVGVGLTPGIRPEGLQHPIPPSYMHVLSLAMGDHPIPVEMEPRFVQAVAFKDYEIAKAAVAGWDQRGYLVIVADRFHVEGGKGISWQAARQVGVSVHAFLLADAGSPCFTGDQVWR